MTTQIGRLWRLAIMLVIGSGCGDGTAIVVTVSARPQVLATDSLQVTATNDGDSEQTRFPVGSNDFPLTFSVTPSGRAGDVTIDIIAVDDTQLERGVGSVTGTIVDGAEIELDVLLDPADFVVNTSTVGAQKPVFRNARNGRQVGVAAGGDFVVPFVDDCSQSDMECNVYARLFDSLTVPAVNQVGGDSDEFQVNLDDGVFGSVPAIAVGDSVSLVAFELFSNDVDDIRVVVLNGQGGLVTPIETVASSGTPMLRPSDPDAAALEGDEFVVVWSQARTGGGREIRGRLVGSDGLPIVNNITGDDLEFEVSTAAAMSYENPSVFATRNGREFIVVWEGDDNVFIKFFNTGGVSLSAADTTVTTLPAGATVFGPKAVMVSDGNAVVSWGVHVFGDVNLERGAFQLGKFAPPAGAVIVAPIDIAGPLLEAAPAMAEPLPPFGATAMAHNGSGQVVVTWQECIDSDGAPKDCDVVAQRFDEDAAAIGDRVVVNTTRVRDQESPSIESAGDSYIVVWTDNSEREPDTSLASVRARALFFSE